ncbi:DinB family protein [Sphingobacterium sp.]|uniref:DinB family protein n=1 Tax=Sphingobacterium sp. TaxID=341027 RepID=UPI002587DC20|nr:DinB family protein [Sphingobacterium sp.]WET67653.1 MAG: DinB family protein [Sphingobacterium sp.]
MKYKSLELLDQLVKQVQEHISFVNSLEALSQETFHKRAHEGSWNILECIQHLNLYGSFYLPEITKKISESNLGYNVDFKSGFLGNYFANSILPNDKEKKMKTFRKMDPRNLMQSAEPIPVFLEQQNRLLHLLDKARSKDLTKIRIRLSFSNWIQLRLGDIFRFIIHHNTRHIVQIKNILSLPTTH